MIADFLANPDWKAEYKQVAVGEKEEHVTVDEAKGEGAKREGVNGEEAKGEEGKGTKRKAAVAMKDDWEGGFWHQEDDDDDMIVEVGSDCEG